MAPMSSMGGMPMPGGWTMTMVWMRMPGQSWPAAAWAFLGMWVVMMVPMMLPSLVPMLRRYRAAAVAAGARRLALLTGIVAAGYFAVWTTIAAIVYPIGAGVAAMAMRYPLLSRAMPVVAAAAVVFAGLLQFTQQKSRQLACCGEAPRRVHGGKPAREAWRHGIALGVRCSACCANLVTILLVLGVMDGRVMAAVTAAITVERVGVFDQAASRATGMLAVAVGIWLATVAL